MTPVILGPIDGQSQRLQPRRFRNWRLCAEGERAGRNDDCRGGRTGGPVDEGWHMKWLNIITLLLLIVGGVNWGLVALGGHEMDLVANAFGGDESGAARLVYALV